MLTQSRLILINRLSLKLDAIATPEIILNLIQIFRPDSRSRRPLHISTRVMSSGETISNCPHPISRV